MVIPLNRFTLPSSYASGSSTLFPTSHYEIAAHLEQVAEDNAFPKDVLSKIRLQMSIPDRVSTDDEKISFSIRLRTSGLPESQCSRLRVHDFIVDVEQSERYRYVLCLDLYWQAQ